MSGGEEASARRGATERDPVVVILAAGRSSRMRRCKALVPIGGEAALARVLRIVREARLRPLVVLGFAADEIEAAIALAPEERVVNPDPARGQSSSAQAGAAAVAAGAPIALWPVDHARVEAATFAALLAAFRTRAPGIELVVPSCDGRRGHPLFAGPAAARELAQLKAGEPAHVVVRRGPARVQHVVVADRGTIDDFDTPDDLLRGPAEAPR